jgi:integrase
MAKSVLRLVSPATENRTVERSMPSRRPNADIRPREHLTEREVEDLIAAARGNRWGQRDATMILIAFRHGLRASEVCELQWSDVEFETGNLHLRRAKGGVTSTHPLLGYVAGSIAGGLALAATAAVDELLSLVSQQEV